MNKSVLLSAVTALALSTSGAVAAGGGDQHIVDFDFSFEGPFGKFDQMQLQRGLQVYTEVCSACHGLRYIPIRTLHDAGGPGLPEDQVRLTQLRTLRFLTRISMITVPPHRLTTFL